MSLSLHFLGLPQVHLDDQSIITDRRKAIALLAYLSVNDIGHLSQKYSREALSALLWPDYEQAKAFTNLRRTIWEVHQVLGANWLIADRESVWLNPEAEIDLDVACFQDLLAQSQEQSDPMRRIQLLSEAAKLYRNHFLTGFTLKDSFPFNEWTFAESDELRSQLAQALTTLSDDYCGLGKAEKAIPHARRLISLDPLNESAHRRLMEVYLQAGQPGAALKQYQTCEQILRKELNLDPQPETRELYKKTRKGKRELNTVQVDKPIENAIPKSILPVQLSTFIGREKEEAEIINLLSRNRLVTLAGVGGIGKTRLSLQVGRRLLNEYPDGVWFIPLDSLSDPALVPQTVASVFDIREGSDRSVVEILLNLLREKSTLLILDNCEHLLDACAEFITVLLQNCSNLHILVTSRELINLAGEVSYYVPALPIPEENVAENLDGYASVQLFAERAGLALSSFALTKENANTVVEICRLVDGIPLAIELAAARVNILQVEEILKQLQRSFTLLFGDRRKIAPRQQTLQASMDWSWGLLGEAEQIFLRQLSIFAGGWTLDSAQAVCEGDVLGLTSALVKKSLIMVDRKSKGETRYRFHEIVRQYVHEKLDASIEKKIGRARHLKYFLTLSEQAEPALLGPAQLEWMARLTDDRDNIRIALEWADETDIEAGLYISGRLSDFWENFDMREGTRWLERFVGKPESKLHRHARANALLALGWLASGLDLNEEARSYGEECLKLYRASDDKSREIDALLLLSTLVNRSEAGEFHQQALDLARSLNDTRRMAQALYYSGWGRNLSYIKEALNLFQQAGDLRHMAMSLSELGRIELLNNDLEAAQKYLIDTASLARELNIKNMMSDILQGFGRIAARKGEYEQAYVYLHEGAMIDQEYGYQVNYLFTRSHIGYLALYQGESARAREIFTETGWEFFKNKNEIGVIFNLEGMAGVFVAIDKPEIAVKLIGLSDSMREKIGDPRFPFEQVDVDKIIAACLAEMGEVAFSDAYEEGQKMTIDEAVAYAFDN